MNILKPMPEKSRARDKRAVPIDRDTELRHEVHPGAKRRSSRVFIAGALLLAGGLAFGVWQHSRAEAEVKATSERRRDLVLNVRVVPVRANDAMMEVKLPGSTEAFEAANILARTSGYIAKRHVDIGDRVKAGQISPR
jgi:multidrug efflux pump subunit AcrA (membrane-fusion protein)